MTMEGDGLTPAEFAKLQSLPPADAIRWMQGRTGTALTYSWQDLWQEEHSRQFTVSRLARVDLLQQIKEGISASVAGNLTRRDWIRETEQLLAGAGWWGEKDVLDPVTGKMVKTTFNPARMQLIYDTNTRQAAAQGQWERIQRSKASHPYLRYMTMGDSRVRAEHAAWDNVTLPADHPFFQTHFPPCGYRCRCRVTQVSQEDYDKGATPTGAAMVKTAPAMQTREFANQRTGDVSQVPVGVTPGFGSIPTQAERLRELDALVEKKLKSTAPGIAGAAKYEGLTLQSAAATFAEKVRLAPTGNENKLPSLFMAPVAEPSLVRLQTVMDQFGTDPDLLKLNLKMSAKVPLEEKMLGLEHDSTRHIWFEHGLGGPNEKRELLRGQVPIEPGDIAAFASIFNSATTLKVGNPPQTNGAPLIEGEAVFGEFRYEFAAKVTKLLIAPVTLYKWRIKP